MRVLGTIGLLGIGTIVLGLGFLTAIDFVVWP